MRNNESAQVQFYSFIMYQKTLVLDEEYYGKTNLIDS